MTHPLIPDDSFPPGRNDLCFCGSAERFKRCCGTRARERSPPYGIGLVEGFLDHRECRALVELADGIAGKRFTLPDGHGGRKLDDQRVTEWVDMRDSHQALLNGIVARAFEEHIVPSTGRRIDWYEEAELLRYAPGGYYLHHSDAYLFDPEHKGWRKVVDRDISVLIYVNDGYQGGELEFKRLSYTVRPREGLLVWFPSDVRYEHMAKPLRSGRRYVLVSWAAATGVERVQARPARGAIMWRP